jgi:hypothetical protein
VRSFYMNSRIEELVGLTKKKFGLVNYYLKRHRLSRNVNIFGDTSYLLCMEWFPNDASELEDDDSNPDGTAVIEIDVNTCKFVSVIFVMDKTYAEKGITFADLDPKSMIKWVEQETGLTYGQQFYLHKDNEGELLFNGCFEGTAVFPAGIIEVKWNQEGNLTSFFAYGQFPTREMVNEETFELTFEKVENLAKEQLKLIEYPSFEQMKLISVYAIEEIFVMNDGKRTISFEVIADTRSYMKIDKLISWKEPINEKFERSEMNWIEEVTAEQAFLSEPSPDSLPITMEEQTNCQDAVTNLLRQEYPSDTGKWILSSLHRDKGNIHAILRANQQDNLVFRRKLMIILDSSSFQVVNYMDNKPMLELYDSFESPDKVMITKEEAFESIKGKIELKPFYVFDFEQRRFVLCGKIDCQHGINAVTGEVIALDELL